MSFFYTHYYYLPDLYLLTCFILKYYAFITLVFFLFLKHSNFFCLKAVELDAVLVYYSLLYCALPFSCVWLFVTLWTLAYHALLSMGFSRQEYRSGLPCPAPGDLPNTGIKPRSPTLQVDSLRSEPPGKSVKSDDQEAERTTKSFFSGNCSMRAQSLSHVWLFATLSHISSISCFGRQALCH